MPNELGRYDQTPDSMAALLGAYAREGWINLVGGCCGTTPEHIAEIARRVSAYRPRARHDPLFTPLLAA